MKSPLLPTQALFEESASSKAPSTSCWARASTARRTSSEALRSWCPTASRTSSSRATRRASPPSWTGSPSRPRTPPALRSAPASLFSPHGAPRLFVPQTLERAFEAESPRGAPEGHLLHAPDAGRHRPRGARRDLHAVQAAVRPARDAGGLHRARGPPHRLLRRGHLPGLPGGGPRILFKVESEACPSPIAFNPKGSDTPFADPRGVPRGMGPQRRRGPCQARRHPHGRHRGGSQAKQNETGPIPFEKDKFSCSSISSDGVDPIPDSISGGDAERGQDHPGRPGEPPEPGGGRAPGGPGLVPGQRLQDGDRHQGVSPILLSLLFC